MHAKAAGAFGTFEVTHDISDITSAKFLNGVGTTTPVMLRISTVARERGSVDTERDVRGWAMKFFTQEGNQDWVFNNTVCQFRFSSSNILTYRTSRSSSFVIRSSFLRSTEVRVFGAHCFSFEPTVESRDMSREHLLFRRILKLATPPQTSKTDSEMIISTQTSSEN